MMIDTEKEHDEKALYAFTKEMSAKLAQKRDEGRGGWWDESRCDLKELERLLLDHHNKYGSVDSGHIDPHQLVDIANLAMMLWWRLQKDHEDGR